MVYEIDPLLYPCCGATLIGGNSGELSVVVFHNPVGDLADGFETGTPDSWSSSSP